MGLDSVLGRQRLRHGWISSGAVATPAEDFEMVLNIAEPVFGGNAVSPAFDSRAFDLNGAPAVPANEMVMVAHRATSVGGFAVVGADQVELVGIGHHLKSAIDGGQPDVFAVSAEVIVNLAGGAEVVGAGEQVGNGGTLPRLPLRHSYHVAIQCRVVTPTTLRQRFSIRAAVR
jgi:hypothetical protein